MAAFLHRVVLGRLGREWASRPTRYARCDQWRESPSVPALPARLLVRLDELPEADPRRAGFYGCDLESAVYVR